MGAAMAVSPAADHWRADPTNLLIISPTGGRKTYLACAIGIAACQHEHAVYFTRMDDLARRLVIARSDGNDHGAFPRLDH